MPKRKSEEEKALTGSVHVLPTVQVAAIDAAPAAGLDEIAQAEWKRISESYDRLTTLDEGLLCLYCSAFSRWKRAEHALAQQGEVLQIPVRSTHGRITHRKPVTNPMLRVVEQAARAMHKYAAELGLTPASRVKQGYQFKAKPKSAWEIIQANKAKQDAAKAKQEAKQP